MDDSSSNKDKQIEYSAFDDFFENYAARLDLAQEAHQLLQGRENREVKGVREDIVNFPQAKVTAITILDEEGAKNMGRKIGKYITIDAPGIGYDKELLSPLGKIVADNLTQLMPEDRHKKPVLLVGLGNDHSTPDSLGPKVIKFTPATRHILNYNPQEMDNNLTSLCSIAPGVLGITGIETAEIIKGIVEHVHPAYIIAIDSLAAASVERIGVTIQLGNTGINPGSGMGNKLQGINIDTMGVPVIAIGVPTVVNTTVIIYETLTTLLKYWMDNGYKRIPALDKNTVDTISQRMLESFDGNFLVTPKEIDELILNVAKIIAAGILQAVHKGVNENNFASYLN